MRGQRTGVRNSPVRRDLLKPGSPLTQTVCGIDSGDSCTNCGRDPDAANDDWAPCYHFISIGHARWNGGGQTRTRNPLSPISAKLLLTPATPSWPVMCHKKNTSPVATAMSTIRFDLLELDMMLRSRLQGLRSLWSSGFN